MNAQAELDGKSFAAVAQGFTGGQSNTEQARRAGFSQRLFGDDFARLSAEHLLLVRAEALDLPVEQMEQVGRNAGLAESIGEVPRHNPDHGLNTKPGLIATSAGMGCRSENSAG